jgi:PleD family two-component response regulator
LRQKAIEIDALAAGVDVFLTKPCLPEDLEMHVRRRLQEPKKSR